MAITQEQRAKLAAGLMRMLELQEKQATLVRAAISLLTQAEWHPAVRANQNQSLTTRSNGKAVAQGHRTREAPPKHGAWQEHMPPRRSGKAPASVGGPFFEIAASCAWHSSSTRQHSRRSNCSCLPFKLPHHPLPSR